jgi:hypothetical protein
MEYGSQGWSCRSRGDRDWWIVRLVIYKANFASWKFFRSLFLCTVSIAWNAPSPSLLARDQSSHQRFARNGFALVFKTRSQSSNFATQSTLYECWEFHLNLLTFCRSNKDPVVTSASKGCFTWGILAVNLANVYRSLVSWPAQQSLRLNQDGCRSICHGWPQP